MTTATSNQTTGQKQFSLTPDEVEQYHRDGFIGPFPMLSPEEMIALHPQIEQMLWPEGKSLDGLCTPLAHNRYLDQPLILDWAKHPAIVDRMTSIMGPDLLLWRTHFWVKDQNTPAEIPWHQDANYWPVEPAIIISAWIAIDEVTEENCCVQIIPGSHRKIVPHRKSPKGMAFGEMAEPEYVDESKAVNMCMKPGEAFLFTERTLHHSNRMMSNKRRIGIALRVIVPIVRVLNYDNDDHRLPVIAGEDRMGFNRLMD